MNYYWGRIESENTVRIYSAWNRSMDDAIQMFHSLFKFMEGEEIIRSTVYLDE